MPILELAKDHQYIQGVIGDFAREIISLTAERDSETSWAKQYCDEMVSAQKACQHLEKVMDGMKAEIETLTFERDAARHIANEYAWNNNDSLPFSFAKEE